MAKPSTTAAAEALCAVANCLTMHGIPFMLDGGTLLGAVRDGTFCTDDQDDIPKGWNDGMPQEEMRAVLSGPDAKGVWWAEEV